MELLSSLKTSSYMPLPSGQNELTGKAPRSHGDEPGAQESSRLSPAWAPPPPPFSPLGSPEIGLEKSKWVVLGPQPQPWESSI